MSDDPGHNRRYTIDFSKIQREIGWQPRYDFSTGLKQTVHDGVSPIAIGDSHYYRRNIKTTTPPYVAIGNRITSETETSLQ